MGRKWNPDEINDSPDLSPGTYHVRCLEFTEGEVNGRLVYRGNFEVIEPTDVAGMRQSATFFIGTEDDPEGNDPKTWQNSIAAKDLKRCFKALRVPMGSDLDVMCSNAVGSECVFKIVQTPRKDKASGAIIPGEFYTNVRGWAEVGMVPVNASGKPAGTPVKAATPGASASPVGKTTATAKAIPKAAVSMLECPVCQESVPKAGFEAHYNKHELEEAEA